MEGGLSPERHAAAEPVRSRWTPKPEQILILESIFNSGMVNPPKDETVRIRKLLERFGAVGDANVFYWFQIRKSRSKNKLRTGQLGLGLARAGLRGRCGSSARHAAAATLDPEPIPAARLARAGAGASFLVHVLLRPLLWVQQAGAAPDVHDARVAAVRLRS